MRRNFYKNKPANNHLQASSVRLELSGSRRGLCGQYGQVKRRKSDSSLLIELKRFFYFHFVVCLFNFNSALLSSMPLQFVFQRYKFSKKKSILLQEENFSCENRPKLNVSAFTLSLESPKYLKYKQHPYFE